MFLVTIIVDGEVVTSNFPISAAYAGWYVDNMPGAAALLSLEPIV